MSRITIVLIVFFLGTTQLLGQRNKFESQTGWFYKYQGTEQSIIEYLKNSKLDAIEGIWSYNVEMSFNGNVSKRENYQKIAIIRDKQNLKRDYIGITLDLSQESKELIESTGVFKYAITSEFSKTAHSNIYLQKGYKGKMKIQGFPETENILIDKDGILRISNTLTMDNGDKISYEIYAIKLLPLVGNKESEINKSKVSGTGFALTPNGLIVTNNHVIEGVNKIVVRGVNGNFDKAYAAKVVITDKINDLAILKIDDLDFTSLGNVPYMIKTQLDSIGENVFVLGYPLRATMGDEIKLTDGIISSKRGFMGDVTSYQISVPIQPGNSGGPLFNKNGELIGIVNSKHLGAENVSYAVKAAYLINLIDLIESEPKLQTESKMKSKTLIQQVETAKKFVYIIEGI